MIDEGQEPVEEEKGQKSSHHFFNFTLVSFRCPPCTVKPFVFCFITGSLFPSINNTIDEGRQILIAFYYKI